MPRLRGVLDPCAASRWQGTAHVPVLGLRPPRPAENGSGNGLVKGRAAAANVSPQLSASFTGPCPVSSGGRKLTAGGRKGRPKDSLKRPGRYPANAARPLAAGQFDCGSWANWKAPKFEVHIRSMQIRPSILITAILLAAAILFVLRDDLRAHGQIKECGFWGPMSAGLSCK